MFTCIYPLQSGLAVLEQRELVSSSAPDDDRHGRNSYAGNDGVAVRIS